jgi:hypothetical protein
MSYQHPEFLRHGWVISGLFGALFFVVLAGVAPLDVTNVGWIFQHGDIATAQTGWAFYRYAPWSQRIALNPTYGMDFGGSIVFSDAVPLMAIVFKALSPLLPETFQYFGLWVFLSFVLQGVFGWMLMSRAVDNPIARILGAFIISLTPVYCFRFVSPLCAHMSLTAHWIVLAALSLCLPPHAFRPWLWWGLLLCITAFVHIYLFAMAVTLWLADLARRAFLDIRATWMEPLGIGAVLAALIALTGVWVGPSGEAEGGFGWFKMNVFAFIDPNVWLTADKRSWSVAMPNLPNWDGDYEGFAYLGLGGILLVILAVRGLPSLLRSSSPKAALAYAPLVVALVGMCIFALSHNVTFGTLNVFVPWPRPLQSLGELFRATGRFVWPLYYFLFFAAVFIIARCLSPRNLVVVLAVAAIVQAIDIAPGWSSANAYLRERGPGYQTKLMSPFWSEAARRYQAVRIAPHKNRHPDYLDVAIMARANGLHTDAVYLSRSSTPATAASNARIERGISTGNWPRDTLFIINEVIARRAAATADRTRHLLARVDGVIVLAPDWEGCTNCGATTFE